MLGFAHFVRLREQRLGVAMLASTTGDSRENGQPQGVPKRRAAARPTSAARDTYVSPRSSWLFVDRRGAAKAECVGERRSVTGSPSQSDACLEQLGGRRELALRHGEVPGAE